MLAPLSQYRSLVTVNILLTITYHSTLFSIKVEILLDKSAVSCLLPQAWFFQYPRTILSLSALTDVRSVSRRICMCHVAHVKHMSVHRDAPTMIANYSMYNCICVSCVHWNTGRSVNITDAQKHPQFFKEVDKSTGFFTKYV